MRYRNLKELGSRKLTLEEEVRHLEGKIKSNLPGKRACSLVSPFFKSFKPNSWISKAGNFFLPLKKYAVLQRPAKADQGDAQNGEEEGSHPTEKTRASSYVTSRIRTNLESPRYEKKLLAILLIYLLPPLLSELRRKMESLREDQS